MADTQTTIQSELHSNETLVWAAQPKPSTHARPWLGISLLIVISILILVYSTLTSQPEDDTSRPLQLTIIALLGLGSVILPLWKKIKARWIFYGITNKRVLIVSTWPMFNVHSFYARDLVSLERKWMQPDGRGTLMFGISSPKGTQQETHINWGFYGIENAVKVEEILQTFKQTE